MKRMILASLIGLLTSGAYASDLTYGGPYSQLKVKLCSDTPPSRSILPDGSLVCEGESNDPDAYCVGGFNYADTDIFNCSTEVFDSEDLNFNGIPDRDEDWDGDGIVNGEDPNPTENSEINVDANGNGIPDSVEEYYDTINNNTAKVIRCDSGDSDCSSFKYNLSDLAVNNRNLGQVIRYMARDNVSNGTFTRQLESLAESIYQQHEFTRYDIELNKALIKGNNSGGVDNSGIIKKGFSDMESGFANMETNFDDLDYNVFRTMSNVSSIDMGISSLNTQVNGVHGHLDETKSDIISAINNGSGGLTSQQKTQLRNAAKAKSNQNLLKQLKTTVGESVHTLSSIKNDISNVANDVNENTNEKFNQLSDQIASISGGTSTVDFSGVESSIDVLSDKIDGIEGGGNGEALAEISGKLDGLATGVTDIGDLLKGVDASKAGIDRTCIQGGICKGFYESAYEGDLSDVVVGQLDSMKTSIVDPFVSSFGNIDLSGAQRPKFGLPVPFYGYMSFDNYIDMDWIFGFLRFIFLASTAFYCRQIIFGG